MAHESQHTITEHESVGLPIRIETGRHFLVHAILDGIL